MVSLQLPGFIGFTAPQLWIEIIEHSLLVRLGSTAHIWHYLVILQGLLQLDRSQGSRLNCWLLLTPAQASDPNLFTLQALSLLSWASSLLSSSWEPQVEEGKREGECILMGSCEFVSVCGQSLRQRRGLWVVRPSGCWVGRGGHGCPDSHLRVSHGGLGGGVSVSGGGRVGPIFRWRLAIDSGLVEGLLGQGSHRHQGIGLVLLIHLERFGLRNKQRQRWPQSTTRVKKQTQSFTVQIWHANKWVLF